MPRRINIIGWCLLLFALWAFKPETKYVKKAVKNIERGNLKQARSYYLKALEKNPESYDANMGLGLLLCEYLDDYSHATPYLEKAMQLTKKDTLHDLIFALGKCYQNNSEFEKALSYYNLLKGVVDLEEEVDFEKEVQKRREDCLYAMEHREQVAVASNAFVVNAGRRINTDMPEYVPVLANGNELLFTSKRKDDEKEELSYLDAKYFESMYVSKLDSSGFGKTRRYTLPDQNYSSHFLKNHESVISVSQDNTKLFTFYEGKLYEIALKDRANTKPTKLQNNINFNQYQNHAFLTRDGNTIYFTSEAKGGKGGNDIYKSTKNSNGVWGTPENLGEPINTSFDEEAPFLSQDGLTLYFASKGHPGYGNFDMYKSNFVNGQWTKPENLGEPINSPGNDLFLLQDSAAATGYFASSRKGGFGDMDIYKIIYIDKINRTCPTTNLAPVTIVPSNNEEGEYNRRFEARVPENYRILGSEWMLNGQVLGTQAPELTHRFPGAGEYTLEYKLIALCDTCVMPIVSCNNLVTVFEKPVITTPPITDSLTPVIADVSKLKGVLSADQLASLGFNNGALLFDFNKSSLRSDALAILGPNIEVLKKYPTLKVQIEGYSDARGSETRNNTLSAERAKAVKQFLLKNGVKKSQLKQTKGLGANNLVNNCGVGANCSEEQHQQNRRVVLIVSGN